MSLAETVKLRAPQIKDDGPQGIRVLNIDLQVLDDSELTLDTSCDDSPSDGIPSYFEFNAK